MDPVIQWCACAVILLCALSLWFVVWWMAATRKRMDVYGQQLESLRRYIEILHYQRHRCGICGVMEPHHDVRVHADLHRKIRQYSGEPS